MGRLLLTLSVLLVAIIFMGTSFVVATGHGNQFMVSGDNAHSAPYAQGNSIINASHVYTTTSSPEKTFIGGLSVHKDASVTNKVIQNITVGKNPAGVAFDSLNGYVYVTHDNSSIVSVINGSTNKVIQNITVGKNPAEVAFDSLNGYVYVTNRGSNNISVINGSTNKVIQSIAVGSSPAGVAFDSLNGHMYVTNCCSNNVSVINGSTNKVIQSIAVGLCPVGIAFDSLNGNIYVTNCCSNNVSVINGSTNKVIQSIAVGSGPVGVAFDSLNGNIYVANQGSNSVSVLGYVKYAVTFTETALPSGSTWYVNITGHNSGALTGTTCSVNLTNGTFAYTVQTNNKLYEPSISSGSLMVNGSAIQETITFSHVYKVTFTETGLPSGTVWFANVTNSTGHIFHGNSSTNTITFNLIMNIAVLTTITAAAAPIIP